MPSREQAAAGQGVAEHAGPRGFVAPPSGQRLFRRRAVERYTRRQEESVLPRLARPRAFAAFWALLLVLGVLAGVVGIVPLADERRLPLVVGDDGLYLVVPAPAGGPAAGDPAAGDPVRFALAGEEQWGRVGEMGEGAVPPAELAHHLGIDSTNLWVGAESAGLVLDGPVRVVPVEPRAPLEPRDFRGAVIEARVIVGRPRAVTLLPGLGPHVARWLGELEERKP